MADRRLLIAAGQAVPGAAQLPDGMRMLIDAAEEPRIPITVFDVASA